MEKFCTIDEFVPMLAGTCFLRLSDSNREHPLRCVRCFHTPIPSHDCHKSIADPSPGLNDFVEWYRDVQSAAGDIHQGPQGEAPAVPCHGDCACSEEKSRVGPEVGRKVRPLLVQFLQARLLVAIWCRNIRKVLHQPDMWLWHAANPPLQSGWWPGAV